MRMITLAEMRRMQEVERSLNDSERVKPVLVASSASPEGREALHEALRAWIVEGRCERRGYVVALGDEFVGRSDPAACAARIDADPFHAMRNALRLARRAGRGPVLDEVEEDALTGLCAMFREVGPMAKAAIESGIAPTVYELVATTREERLADLAARTGR